MHLRHTLHDARTPVDADARARLFVNVPQRNVETGVTASLSGHARGKMLSHGGNAGSVSPRAHLTAVANLDTLFRLATVRLARQSRTPEDVGAV